MRNYKCSFALSLSFLSAALAHPLPISNPLLRSLEQPSSLARASEEVHTRQGHRLHHLFKDSVTSILDTWTGKEVRERDRLALELSAWYAREEREKAREHDFEETDYSTDEEITILPGSHWRQGKHPLHTRDTDYLHHISPLAEDAYYTTDPYASHGLNVLRRDIDDNDAQSFADELVYRHQLHDWNLNREPLLEYRSLGQRRRRSERRWEVERNRRQRERRELSDWEKELGQYSVGHEGGDHVLAQDGYGWRYLEHHEGQGSMEGTGWIRVGSICSTELQ